MSKLEDIERELEVDPEEAREVIVDFIGGKVDEAGANGVVLGLSGGLDSTTAAFLSQDAWGSDDVFALFMPEKGVTKKSTAEHARKVAGALGIELREVEISSMLDEMKHKIDFNECAKVAHGNLKARTRMVIIYYYANLLDHLVVGPSNRSEIRSGYFTKYGDGAADIFPLARLYKTQVRELARGIGVPDSIIDKPPSAGLWEGQCDKDELGLCYDEMDRIYAGLDLGMGRSEIADVVGVEEPVVKDLVEREESSEHKLGKPPMPEM